jgi:hypothetical protein
MHWFSFGVALLAAVGIIAVGTMYVLRPRLMTPNFGLPLPEEGRNTTWWLRLKGSRDIVSGLVVLALMLWGDPYLVGLVLLIEAVIPASDIADSGRERLGQDRFGRARTHGSADGGGSNPFDRRSGVRDCIPTRCPPIGGPCAANDLQQPAMPLVQPQRRARRPKKNDRPEYS